MTMTMTGVSWSWSWSWSRSCRGCRLRRRRLPILSRVLLAFICFAAISLAHAFVIPSEGATATAAVQQQQQQQRRRQQRRLTKEFHTQIDKKTRDRTMVLFMAKQKFTVNENLVGSINSNGVFEGRENVERPKSTKLGVASSSSSSSSSKAWKNKSGSPSSPGATGAGRVVEQQQQPLSKKERQRTANGTMDSNLSTRIAAPEQEAIQVVEAKRGSKVVTIVR